MQTHLTHEIYNSLQFDVKRNSSDGSYSIRVEIIPLYRFSSNDRWSGDGARNVEVIHDGRK